MTVYTFLTILIPALFASQGFWALILYKVQKREEKKDLGTKADLAILHDLVYRYCKAAILRGHTNFDEFDNITELYNVYKELGGNGTGQRLYEEYSRLPKDVKEETI